MNLYERTLALKLFNVLIEEDSVDYLSTIFNNSSQSLGKVICKQSGIVSGIELAKEFALYAGLTATPKICDGNQVELENNISKELIEIIGPTNIVLQIERPLCNLLMHLSGIATTTARIVNLVKQLPVRICPTRKTTPGLRYWEKQAVVHGGGSLHRFGLADGVMLKDNHIAAFCGDIEKMIHITRKKIPHTIKIEVEIDNTDQIEPAIKAGADILLLDNFSPENIVSTVKFCRDLEKQYQDARYQLGCGKLLLEASGGINEDNVLIYAQSGVDIISLGSLTHSVKALNISMDLVNL